MMHHAGFVAWQLMESLLDTSPGRSAGCKWKCAEEGEREVGLWLLQDMK